MSTDVVEAHSRRTETIRTKAAVVPLFSTWVYQCGEGPAGLNAELEALTYRLMRDEKNAVLRTNVGGWHYAFDLFRLDEPVVHAFRADMERHVQAYLNQLRGTPDRRDRFSLEGWINVNRAGDENLLHCHPGAFVSGTYYVRTPADMSGGRIFFRDPRGPAVAMYEAVGLDLPWVGTGGGVPFIPAVGQLLLFPAWLEHRVERFDGTGDRISIAFNAVNPR